MPAAPPVNFQGRKSRRILKHPKKCLPLQHVYFFFGLSTFGDFVQRFMCDLIENLQGKFHSHLRLPAAQEIGCSLRNSDCIVARGDFTIMEAFVEHQIMVIPCLRKSTQWFCKICRDGVHIQMYDPTNSFQVRIKTSKSCSHISDQRFHQNRHSTNTWHEPVPVMLATCEVFRVEKPGQDSPLIAIAFPEQSVHPIVSMLRNLFFISEKNHKVVRQLRIVHSEGLGNKADMFIPTFKKNKKPQKKCKLYDARKEIKHSAPHQQHQYFLICDWGACLW